MNFVVRLLINALALWLATRLVDGISFDGEIVFLFVVAMIFGVVNTIVKPILMVLTFPFLIVTLGLFLLVLNGVMLVADRRHLRRRRTGISRQQLQGRVHRRPGGERCQLCLSLMVGDSKRKSRD